MRDAKRLELQIFAEQVSLLFRQYLLCAASGLLVSWVVAFILWNQVPKNLLSVWLVLQDTLLLAGFVLERYYRYTDAAEHDDVLLYRVYFFIVTGIGILWGGLALFLQFLPATAYQMFLVITITGLASAALVLAIPVRSAYYSYLTFCLLPLIYWFFSQARLEFTALAILAIFFLSLLLFAGTGLNRHLVNTIRLRYQNVDLLNEIKQLNSNLEHRVKEKTLELFESEERFNLAMQGANDGLWDVDLLSRKVYFSPRWKAMLGYEEDEIGCSAREWINRLHPEEKRQVVKRIRDHCAGKTEYYESVHRVRHRNGYYLWVLDRGRAVYNHDGGIYRMVGTQVDITEQKKLEEKFKAANIKLKHEAKERQLAQEELAYLAKHDPLTDLPNRTLFFEQLEKALRNAELEGDAIAVLLVDLDNFKHVNDTLGHPAGDVLLKDVAKRLTSIVNRNYFLSRFGGDEFLVILEGCSDTFLIDAYAREIVDLLSKPFYLGDQEIVIGCSIGITIYPDHGIEPNKLIQDADIAMYHAKEEGRNTFRYFTDEMDREITEKVRLKNQLHGALSRNEFHIHYQPQVDIATGKVSGIEALLRWDSPDIGSVSPEIFVPMLEETGMITDVGYWVLRAACKQALSLVAQGYESFRMAVNFSPNQFMAKDLVNEIKAILDEVGLSAKYLEIEITENVFMKDRERIYEALNELKQLGVFVTLDDFGTGYSSLEYLKRFPINGLKIDKTFVADLASDKGSQELVAAIIAMSKTLNMQSLVAEGVETKAQLNLLRKAECQTYQGYLYSKPLPPEALENLVLRGVRHLAAR